MTAKVGRPRNVPSDIVIAILMARADGISFGTIANALDAAGIPTAQNGRRWWPSTVYCIAMQEA